MSSTEFNPYAPPEAEIGGEIAATPSGPDWLTILFRPRATIRRILDSGRTRAAGPMTVVFVISIVLPEAYRRSLDKDDWFVRLMIDDLGPALLAAVGLLYLFGYLIGLAGRWIGGTARAKDVRTAIAWSMVLLLPCGLIQLAAFLLYGVSTGGPSPSVFDLDQLITRLGLSFLKVITAVWTIILWVKCVGEAHRFSALKAIGAGMLAMLIYMIGFVAIAGSGMLVSYLISK